jgi:hypothetical protein
VTFDDLGTLGNATRLAELDLSFEYRSEPQIDRFVQIPAVRSWWSRHREYHPDPFRAKVDDRLRRIVEAGGSD